MSYRDINDVGNSPKYHTGKKCIGSDIHDNSGRLVRYESCEKPAGTAWSPYWCVEHNIERMDKINDELAILDDLFTKREARDGKVQSGG